MHGHVSTAVMGCLQWQQWRAEGGSPMPASLDLRFVSGLPSGFGVSKSGVWEYIFDRIVTLDFILFC